MSDPVPPSPDVPVPSPSSASADAVPPGAPVPSAAPAPAGKPRNLPGVLALAFAIVGFVLGVIPATSGLAWLLLVPAIILGIVGLARRGRPKALALAGLIVGVVGLIVAIIVAAVTFFAAVGDAVSKSLDAPTSASSADAGSSASAAAKEAKIGDTVTNSDGVAFTVNSIQCGIAHAGDQYTGEDAKGQFCEVKFTVQNGGSKEITLIPSDLTGYIGSNEYDVDGSTVSTFGGDYLSTSVNPGLSAACDVFIDIPAGQALDYVKFKPAFSFADGVTVSAK